MSSLCWHSPRVTAHITHESRSRTPKRIRIYSVIYYIFTYSYYYDATLPQRRRLAALLPRPRVFFSKRTLKRPVFFTLPHFQPSIFLFFASFRYFLLFRNTSLGKKQTKNMQHRSSNADTIRAESEKVRQANEERLREKRMVRRRLISFFL